MTGRDVRVVFTKYDGSLHWHQTMQYLGEDEHGTWLGGPAGSTAQRGSEPPVVFDEPFVQLVPAGPVVDGGVQRRACQDRDLLRYRPAAAGWKHPGEVTMVDLDLDVVRLRADQRVVIVDQDEFAEHQVRYGYPAEVVTAARRAAAWLHEVVSARAEPFGSAYLGWLAKVC